MQKLLLFFISCLSFSAGYTQSSADNLVQGSKTLVELISVLKGKPIVTRGNNATDSCAVKQIADLCFKNSSSRDLAVTLYRRIENVYDTQAYSVKVLPKKQECLYQLKSGIYKYRIEADSGTVKFLVSEGEFKLQACENMKREIKE